MSVFQLDELGWKPFFEQQLSDAALDIESSRHPARVSQHFGSQISLYTEEGELTIPIQLANTCGPITVGDWVLLESDTHRIQHRFERETEFGRKAPGTSVAHQLIAANIDTLFIVSSCNQDFNLSRLERYLALALDTGSVPVIVLTKADLSDDAADLRRQAERLHPGLLVEVLDARDPQQVAVLANWCGKGKTVALLGSSGVGKSTLASTLGAGELATSGIREADGKGRHTTTSRSLHRMSAGGWLLDTPGMRELQLADCEEGITELFQDIVELADQCRFRDCGHSGDDGCALEAAVDAGQLEQRRLTSFLKLLREQAKNAKSLMERRDDQRKLGRMYKSIIGNKKRSRDLR